MAHLSLIMITKNESEKLARCLNSVHEMVDEIIIVDTGSTDNTKEIASSYHAKIYDFPWTNNFSEARNFALQQSGGDWNLILDSDEYVLKFNAEEIRTFMNGPKAIGKIKVINKYIDDENVAVSQLYISRLIPKGMYYTGRIHEQVVSDLPRINLPIVIEHDGYLNQSKPERNIPILQLEIKEHPNDPYYYYQIAKEYKGLGNHELAYTNSCKAYDLMNKSEGYAPNLVVNHLYNIISANKLQDGLGIITREKGFLSDFPDFHFVCGVYYLALILSNTPKYVHLLPQIENSYKRCIEIGETERYSTVTGTGSYRALYNLGTFYEVTGKTAQALRCYKEAASLGYGPSITRLEQL